jgi:hypothetical protein
MLRLSLQEAGAPLSPHGSLRLSSPTKKSTAADAPGAQFTKFFRRAKKPGYVGYMLGGMGGGGLYVAPG